MFTPSRPHIFTLILLLGVSVEPVLGDWRSDLGWQDLKDLLGASCPDGSGVLVLQSEADGSSASGNQYLPNLGHSELKNKSFADQGSGSDGRSGHALNVARRFCGVTGSLSPGVSNIHAYSTIDYLNSLAADLISSERKVHSCAWVFGYGPSAANALATIDGRINERGFLVVGALNNKSTSIVPQAVSTTYNALSVGLTNGKHSRNGTALGAGNYVAGRIKPEIVIPESYTSYATGAACSLASVLYEAAADLGHGDAEDHSEVMKAIIMAGATKQEFNGWDRNPTRPLDEVFGAGEANLCNSYLILAAGEQNPGSVAPTGWSFNHLDPSNAAAPVLERNYTFTVPADNWAEDFSLILNWNYAGTGSLRNLKLELFSLAGNTVLLDSSNSDKDNVEHIYQGHLPAGDYQVRVSVDDDGDDLIEFGLAWRSQLGDGPETSLTKNQNDCPEVTVTNIFKDQSYVIQRSFDLQTWTTVHSFTPTTWDDCVWEDPEGIIADRTVYYRSGCAAP